MNLSFGEILVLALIALVVIGPKELAPLLRKSGRFLGQARRTVYDMRRDTGLDEIIQGDLRDLERLADHIEGRNPQKNSPYTQSYQEEALSPYNTEPANIDREYPSMGADSTNILPEDALVYTNPSSELGPQSIEQTTLNTAESPATAAPLSHVKTT